ncbi:MAG: FHA domain-containing protein, partial [Thermoanaerobaculia bacterium]
EFLLKPGASVIGRLAQSDIQLPSADVSRRHAQVVFGPDGCFVSDLGSENGVAVNGHRVERHRLEDGDVIVLGKQRLLFRK